MKLPLIIAIFCGSLSIAISSFADPPGTNSTGKVGKLTAAPSKSIPISTVKQAPTHSPAAPLSVGKSMPVNQAKSTTAGAPIKGNAVVTRVKNTTATPLAKSNSTTTSTKNGAVSNVAGRPAQATASLKPALSNTSNSGASPKNVSLQGHIKHHKHPLESLLKEEFDSPIHPVTTDNKDF